MGTREQKKRLSWLAMMIAIITCGVVISACGSDSSSSDSSSGDETASGGTVPQKVQDLYDRAITEPTEIIAKKIGLEPFDPKPGGKIFNITCDQSVVACSNNGGYVKAGAEAIGYDYELCDAGPSADGPNRCFQNAINAKPSVIITTSLPIANGADGYAAAKDANIPVVGMYSGDPGDGELTTTQVGEEGCGEQGRMVAAGVGVQSEMDANVLFVTETSFACVIEREEEFEKEFGTACPDCSLEFLQFDLATMQNTLPQQISAALNQNPDIDWIVGAFDAVAAIAVTQVQQAGKANDIKVAGFDVDPANVQFMQNGEVQALDPGFDFGASGWGTVDIAARIYSGLEVPTGMPANSWMLTQETAPELGEARIWEGPPNYQEQFKELWNQE